MSTYDRATMPCDMPHDPQNTLSGVRSRTSAMHYPQSRTARSSTNGVAPTRADNVRPIEPMLLVHQEQVETFRLIAATLGRGLRVLARSYPAWAQLDERQRQTARRAAIG